MTINYEDVCVWYGSLTPASRIEFLSGFLRLLLPWELRFIGSCLEDLARRDYHVFRESEQRANNLDLMQRISSLHSFTNDEFRALLAVSLALLHSTNVKCATLYSDVLLWNFELARELVRYDEVSRHDIILLYNMAVNHPAFTFDQRQTLCDCLRILQQIERETSIGTASQQNDESSCHIKMMHNVDARVMGISLLRTERTDGHTKPTYQYLFKVIWSNGEVTETRKSLQEFCHFHEKLTTYVSHHENAGGYQLPDVQMQQLLHKDEVPEDVLPILLKYVECLTNMPLHILHSEEVTHFFGTGCGAEPASSIGQCLSHQPPLLANEELVSGVDLDPSMTRSLQPSSIPVGIVAKPSTTPSCASPHNRSLSSLNSRSSSGSLDMPRHSSTGSSPLSTPPSSSDGRHAPRLREEAFTEDKFSDVIDLSKDASRLHIGDTGKLYKSKPPATLVSDHKKPPWLNRTSTVGTNHRPAYSMSSLGESGAPGLETRTLNATQPRPAPAASASASGPAAVYQQRLAAWLKANRMHKYLDRLRKYSYEELLRIDRAQLQTEGFTQGAINKLMGMQEELIRNPASFCSPVPVASASHRSSDSSPSTVGSAGSSDNASPATSAPASPTPMPAGARGPEEAPSSSGDGPAPAPGGPPAEEAPVEVVREEEAAPSPGDGPAVATVPPLVLAQSPQPPQTPQAPQAPLMVMYGSPSPAAPAGYFYSPAGAAPGPAPPPAARYVYYAVPSASPVHGAVPPPPPPPGMAPSRGQAPVSSPQPLPVGSSQAGSVLLLRPGPAALQVGSSVFGCSCQLCQQQQQQQPAAAAPAAPGPGTAPAPAPHQQQQQQPAQPQQQTVVWPNGLVYACPGVSYPCCVTEPQAMVGVTGAQPAAAAAYVPHPGTPMMPFATAQGSYYTTAPPGALSFGLAPAPSHLYPCYPPVQAAGANAMSAPVVGGPRRSLTCYNCGVPGHKSAECQEKTIDCLMSDSYFHLKYQSTEPYGGPASISSPNTPTGGVSVSLEL